MGRRLLKFVAMAAWVFAWTPDVQAQIQLPSQQRGGPSPGSQPGIQLPSAQPIPQPSAPQFWGAIAFTADGSYATAFKYPSKAEAEASVATRCARFGRGACEIIAFPGNLCAALTSYRGGRWKFAFTGGGTTASQAQEVALERCNSDRRTRRRCQLRTVVCGDGR